MSVRDNRRAPFCWQAIEALALLEERCRVPAPDGKPLEMSRLQSIYVALTRVANGQFREGGRDGFEATRASIAERAGVGQRTLDRYIPILEELGLLGVERRRVGGMHVANRWTLHEPGCATSAHRGAVVAYRGAVVAHRGATNGGEEARPLRPRGATNDTRSEEGLQDHLEEAPQPPQAGEQTAPVKPHGARHRDLDEYEARLAAFVSEHFPGAPSGLVAHEATQLRSLGMEPTVEALRPRVDEWHRTEVAA